MLGKQLIDVSKFTDNNVLVAIIPSVADFEIAKSQNWYRIPVKSAPQIVKDNSIKLISFYHTSVFELEKYSIRWYGWVRRISIVKRKQLFPAMSPDKKSEIDYYKIEFDPLQQLAIPIISIRHRRMLFIPTTEEKLFSAKEINFLFNESPLEDRLWSEFVKHGMSAERQLFLSLMKNNYFLDFALYCKERNINIECDGDRFHNKPENIQTDKKRNNLLESAGWSVLRFTSYDITHDLVPSFKIICSTINKNGGIQDVRSLDSYTYISDPSDQQLFLFD